MCGKKKDKVYLLRETSERHVKEEKSSAKRPSLKCQNKFSGTDNGCTFTRVIIYQASTIYKLIILLLSYVIRR